VEHARAVEMLEAVRQHWSIDLVEEPRVDMDDAIRVDAEKVAVVGQMVDRAEGESVDHGRSAAPIAVFDDVRCL
jgi:aminoglycoside phosphotransferase